jgi:hypothetical protein
MDTIQLKCGHCQKVMGIATEHLGQQVQCPHCGLVVQTPAPPRPQAAETVAVPQTPRQEPEPQFSPFAASDPTTPLTPSPSDESPRPTDTTVALADAGAAPDAGAQAEFAQFKPKPRKDRSVFLVIALIFLVPYAFTMTLFVAILIFFRSGGGSDPLEYLRDPMPAPDKGGAKRVMFKEPKHTAPLAAQRKTTIGKSVKAGDLLVTPQRLSLTSDGDLKLVLRVRNTSTNAAFEPIHNSFVNERKSHIKYTFIESHTSSLDNIYGGNLAYFKKADATGDEESFPILGPNEEITIVLETDQQYRAKHVSVIAKSPNDEFTWRVQVRRGLVRVGNKDVSATTVIGVDFSGKDIERERKL